MKNFAKFLVAMMLLSSVAFAQDSGIQPDGESMFNDVDSDTLYYQAINYLAGDELINGNPDGSFAPERSLNRAEMLKMVVEGSDLGDVDLDDYIYESCFDDVMAAEWYTKYVCYGKEMGFVRGYADGTFKAGQEVTFVEALKMAYAAAELDFEEGDIWYQDLVEKAAEEMFIPPSIDDFNKQLTRGEMAEMRTRMIIKPVSSEAFAAHLYSLGDLGEIVPSYETIEAGQNLMEMDVEVIDTNGDDEEMEEEEETDMDDSSEESEDDAFSGYVKQFVLKAEDDDRKYIVIRVVNIDEKDRWEVTDAMQLYMGENEEYAFYYYANGTAFGQLEDEELVQIGEEGTAIAESFNFDGAVAGETTYAYATYGFYLNTTVWGTLEYVSHMDFFGYEN